MTSRFLNLKKIKTVRVGDQLVRTTDSISRIGDGKSGWKASDSSDDDDDDDVSHTRGSESHDSDINFGKLEIGSSFEKNDDSDWAADALQRLDHAAGTQDSWTPAVLKSKITEPLSDSSLPKSKSIKKSAPPALHILDDDDSSSSAGWGGSSLSDDDDDDEEDDAEKKKLSNDFYRNLPKKKSAESVNTFLEDSSETDGSNILDSYASDHNSPSKHSGATEADDDDSDSGVAGWAVSSDSDSDDDSDDDYSDNYSFTADDDNGPLKKPHNESTGSLSTGGRRSGQYDDAPEHGIFGNKNLRDQFVGSNRIFSPSPPITDPSHVKKGSVSSSTPAEPSTLSKSVTSATAAEAAATAPTISESSSEDDSDALKEEIKMPEVVSSHRNYSYASATSHATTGTAATSATADTVESTGTNGTASSAATNLEQPPLFGTGSRISKSMPEDSVDPKDDASVSIPDDPHASLRSASEVVHPTSRGTSISQVPEPKQRLTSFASEVISVKLDLASMPKVDIHKILGLNSSEQRIEGLKGARQKLLDYDTNLSAFLKQCMHSNPASATRDETLGPNARHAFQVSAGSAGTPHHIRFPSINSSLPSTPTIGTTISNISLKNTRKKIFKKFGKSKSSSKASS
ncbi:unnamed protein product [Ambrosiozyma monospora]|uniref:Unnamed protein product n=1 Tax=Ambrosiozyma monospora TaxID=43982 RepID=A0ACB5SS67_AMBMO|nr:unnamed protein product [Ambrosiozyma monospora]